ncbi:MAG: hypothetical protein Q8L85_04670 [Alphaproteobacteria bacterium]|nr:hypothetical protein [Alphaproteobacteria bacterium]
MKRLFMYSLLGFLSFNAFKSEALTPYEAASLAQAAEKRDADYVEGFQLVSQEIARPNGDAVDQILAQLWVNHEEKEYVVVFNTTKAIGKWALADVINKVYSYDDVIAFARQQGRIYNDQVKQAGYPELAGGVVQKVIANLVSGVTNASYGLGRGLSYAASGIGSLFSSSKKSVEMEQIDQIEEVESNSIKKLPEVYLGNLVKTAFSLYLDLLQHVANNEYAIKVVGHCFGGYYAQIIASNNNLGGYSFSSYGMNLHQADQTKEFTNYRHLNDHLTELNEEHYGKTIALNDLPLNVIDNFDDHIRSLNANDVTSTRWAIMDDYLTKNHAIDGFVDQLNPGNKKSKSVQNSNAHIVDNSFSSSALPISSLAIPKADPIVVQLSVAPSAPKPVVSIAHEVKAEEIIIAPSSEPAVSSFAPPPPPPPVLPIMSSGFKILSADVLEAMDDLERLDYDANLATEKKKVEDAARGNVIGSIADAAARMKKRTAAIHGDEVEVKNDKLIEMNEKLLHFREVEYKNISKSIDNINAEITKIEAQQKLLTKSLDKASFKARFDENCLRLTVLKGLRSYA